MISLETQQIMMVIISFSGETDLDWAIDRAKNLLFFAQAENVNSTLIT
jgi:hypothetical protein